MNKIANFPFMKNRKTYYIICIAIIVLGLAVGLIRGFNFGIDFVGGTRIQVEMGQEVPIEDVRAVLDTIEEVDGDVVHAGDGNTQIIIKTTDSINSEVRGKLVDALSEKYGLGEDAVLSVENISASVGDMLKSNAIKAVLIAVICMLIYIAVRFQWKYGVAAIIALANTILIVIAFYGIFHITINSPFIAGMLTILGYGINDTIVIFDRIRENNKAAGGKRGEGLEKLVNKSIAQTVGRSVMTSVTTIAVMIPMLIICGTTIRAFILPLMVGVFASTCSSIFIATSVWFDINKASDKTSYSAKIEEKKKNEKKAAKAAAKAQ